MEEMVPTALETGEKTIASVNQVSGWWRIIIMCILLLYTMHLFLKFSKDSSCMTLEIRTIQS
jgi:hypothetical protein